GFARSEAMTVRFDAPSERTLRLVVRRGATVRVRVLPEGGAPIPSTGRVRVFSDPLPTRRTGFLHPTREEDGRFRFDGVDPGPSVAFVDLAGFLPAMARFVAE